jgi:hypothetical protein
MRPKSRVLVTIGVLPSLAGREEREKHDLYCDGNLEKGRPFPLTWQGHLSCELVSTQAIVQYLYLNSCHCSNQPGGLRHYSSKPMPSLWIGTGHLPNTRFSVSQNLYIIEKYGLMYKLTCCTLQFLKIKFCHSNF